MMLDEIQKLMDTLKLRYAREAVAESLKSAQKEKPSYSAFLMELLRREQEGQRNRATAGRLRRSGLREYWSLDTFPFHIQKCVNKKLIYELAELDFVARGESLVFIGQAAVGKSGLASALLLKTLYAGYRGLAIRAQDLFDAMRASHADRTTRLFFQRLARLDVLLIDEFGYLHTPDPQQLNDFFRLMDDRCNRKTTIITTNMGYDEWGQFLGNASLVAALLSRLLQKCRTVTFPKDAVNLRNPKLSFPTTAPKPDILNTF
jgi:DNA replication protein DnaC